MKEIKYNSSKRTHERIKKAFAELLAEKHAINKITVAELSSRADITRGTFYAHFNNIFEVAEEMENEFVSTLNLTSRKFSGFEHFPEYLHEIFNFLRKNEDLYRQLLISDAPMVFINRLNQEIGKTAHEILREYAVDQPMIELDVTFFVDGASYMILKYFRGDIKMSLDEIEWYLDQRAREMFLSPKAA